MSFEAENLHDAEPSGNRLKPNLSDSEHAHMAQFLLVQTSNDGKLRKGAIKALKHLKSALAGQKRCPCSRGEGCGACLKISVIFSSFDYFWHDFSQFCSHGTLILGHQTGGNGTLILGRREYFLVSAVVVRMHKSTFCNF